MMIDKILQSSQGPRFEVPPSMSAFSPYSTTVLIKDITHAHPQRMPYSSSNAIQSRKSSKDRYESLNSMEKEGVMVYQSEEPTLEKTDVDADSNIILKGQEIDILQQRKVVEEEKIKVLE
jgi:hypothetical protein